MSIFCGCRRRRSCTSFLRHERREDRGSVTIETIIMVPVFGAFLAFVIIAGRAQNVGVDVDAAAAQAARTVTLSDDPRGEGEAEATRIASQTVREGEPTCASMDARFNHDADVEGEDAVEVTITCQVNYSEIAVMPLPGSNSITGQATEVVDRWTETGAGAGADADAGGGG